MENINYSKFRGNLAKYIEKLQGGEVLRYGDFVLVMVPENTYVPGKNVIASTNSSQPTTNNTYVNAYVPPKIPQKNSQVCERCRQEVECRAVFEDGEDRAVCVNCLIKAFGKVVGLKKWLALQTV